MKVKPIWILLEQETASGSDISWAICKSAPRSSQQCQHPTAQFFTGQMLFLPPNQQRQSTEGVDQVNAAVLILWLMLSRPAQLYVLCRFLVKICINTRATR